MIPRLQPALLLIVGCLLGVGQAFVAQQMAFVEPNMIKMKALGLDHAFSVPQQASALGSSSLEISASTLDPTSFLSDILSAFLGSNAILAVPIIAALGLATLIAFFIVSYASPAESDDE